MSEKKKGYGLLLLLTILVTLGGLVTLFPYAAASKANMLGYKSLCTNVPISTLLCFVIAGVLCFIRKKKFT
ncbi:hypothetical protein ACFLQZ_02110 [Acidobacteriota bacterium]